MIIKGTLIIISIFFVYCQYMLCPLVSFALTLPSSVIPDDEEERDFEDGQGHWKRGGTAETAGKHPREREPQVWRVPQGEWEEVFGGQDIVRHVKIWYVGRLVTVTKNLIVVLVLLLNYWIQICFCPDKRTCIWCLKSHTSNGCLVSVVSFEREAKSKQQKNTEIRKLTAEIVTIKR